MNQDKYVSNFYYKNEEMSQRTRLFILFNYVRLIYAGQFICFSAKQANLNFENLLEELPVVFRNSHLVNSLLCEIDEQTRLSSKSNSFLDLGTR